MEIFLDNILRFEVDGSKENVCEFLFLKELYILYKPIFAPISQKINSSFSLNVLIHSIVSSSLL